MNIAMLLQIFYILEKSKEIARLISNQRKPLYHRCLDNLAQNLSYLPYYSDWKTSFNRKVNWECLPCAASPSDASTMLPHDRHSRKTSQVENMLLPCIQIINALKYYSTSYGRCIHVVEFCSGTGFIGIPLAAMYPDIIVTLIDMKGKSIDIARERVNQAKLLNVNILEQNIEDYNENFDIGIALHACGGASDIVIEKCVNRNAAYVICPCCIGKVLFYRSNPLSSEYQNILREENQFKALIRASDFGHSDLTVYSDTNKIRRICKCYVEHDRTMYARSRGYKALMLLMYPTSSSPKNDILIGWPCVNVNTNAEILVVNCFTLTNIDISNYILNSIELTDTKSDDVDIHVDLLFKLFRVNASQS